MPTNMCYFNDYTPYLPISSLREENKHIFLNISNGFRGHTSSFTEFPMRSVLRPSPLKTKHPCSGSCVVVWFVYLWGDPFLREAGSCVLRGYKNGNHFYWQPPGIVLRQMET